MHGASVKDGRSGQRVREAALGLSAMWSQGPAAPARAPWCRTRPGRVTCFRCLSAATARCLREWIRSTSVCVPSRASPRFCSRMSFSAWGQREVSPGALTSRDACPWEAPHRSSPGRGNRKSRGRARGWIWPHSRASHRRKGRVSRQNGCISLLLPRGRRRKVKETESPRGWQRRAAPSPDPPAGSLRDGTPTDTPSPVARSAGRGLGAMAPSRPRDRQRQGGRLPCTR